jgi:hypothetical protein
MPEPAANPIPFRRLLLMPWRWKWWALCITLAAGILIAYGMSYAVLAERNDVFAVTSGFQPQTVVIPRVHYPRTWVLPPSLRKALEELFAPAHQIDRLIRPRYWKVHEVIVE